MVRRGGKDILVRTGYRTKLHLRHRKPGRRVGTGAESVIPVFAIFEGIPRIRVIPLRRARVATVGGARPIGRTEAILAIDVIPPRIDERAVMIDNRTPFARFKVTDWVNIGPVVLHGMQNGGRNAQRGVFPEAPNKPAASFGAEGEAPGREFADVKIVVRPVGQLLNFVPVDGRLKNAPRRVRRPDPAVFFRVTPGEIN